MSNTQQIKNPRSTSSNNSSPRPSSLERFNLGFEYNKTLQEIKREVKQRTI